MGVSEFSASLADFNQTQLNTIETATSDIKVAVNDIKNTDISALNTKVGVNTDAAGTGTLFARAAKIDDATAGLGGKIGVNTDAAGTGTLFARAAQLAAYVDGVEAKTNLIGEVLDAAGVNTVFGKIADVKQTVANKIKYPRQVVSGITLSLNVWSELLSVIGKGKLNLLGFVTNGYAKDVDVRITVDGTLYTYPDVYNDNHIYAMGGILNSAVYHKPNIDLSFDASMKIEIMTASSTATQIYHVIDYGLS